MLNIFMVIIGVVLNAMFAKLFFSAHMQLLGEEKCIA